MNPPPEMETQPRTGKEVNETNDKVASAMQLYERERLNASCKCRRSPPPSTLHTRVTERCLLLW